MMSLLVSTGLGPGSWILGLVAVLQVGCAVGALDTGGASDSHDWRPSGDGAGFGDVGLSGDRVATGLELSDVQGLEALAGWSALPSFGSGEYWQQSSMDRHKLSIWPPVEILSHGNQDMNNFHCKSVDAVIPFPELVPMVLDEPACEEDYVRGFVMARFVGSGRLARLWLTALSFRLGGPDGERLRIYVDDRPEPVVDADLADLMLGSVDPVFAPPFGVGDRTFMAWYYPVVFGNKLIVAVDQLGPLDMFYHQTSVVLDHPSVARHAAVAPLPERQTAHSALGRPPPADFESPIAVDLAAGASRSVIDREGPATIRAVRVTLDASRRGELANVRLEVHWDDEEPAAMSLSLADLFATWMAAPDGDSLALGGRDAGGAVVVWLALPMPFASRALWTLDNLGGQSIQLQWETAVTDAVPAAPWGHLHTQVNRTVTPATGGETHPLAQAAGRGRLVGVCLGLQGHGLPAGTPFAEPFNFLEGDERIVVDGRDAVLGTGTEDYFNNAFYFAAGSFFSPFAQGWGVQPNPPDVPGSARVTACRWHILTDAIDFSTSLAASLEIGPNDPSLLDEYESTAFLYQ